MALARALERPEPESKRRLRLWLRLYAATSVIEREMRGFLRARFASTLPRFDLMAALERTPEDLTMGELSRRLMVSGGNVTSIVTGLERDGLVRRRSPAHDRRTSYVALTEAGRTAFAEMARAHERWINELLADVGDEDVDALTDLLAELKHKTEARAESGEGAMKGADYRPRHFRWEMHGEVAVVTLNRPEKKNPLTFESYAELRDTFRTLVDCDDVKAVVLTGAGENFCSGGDVLEIIAPLTERDTKGLLAFTRMTGDVVKAIRACPQPVIAAIDGVCVGAGACLALASDLRIGTPEAKTAFLFVRVGLAGCDMGACVLLPRIVGQSRAAELLFTGRSMSAEEGQQWGFFNRLCPRERLLNDAIELAAKLAAGPTFAHMMTKTMLNQEWDMSIQAAIEAEAQAQALCMQTEDFRRAYRAFVAKAPPEFEGN
jgi:enoyl-CoA hydratase/carnithine racemase/DNA-binding MarR family transcriptional regulator